MNKITNEDVRKVAQLSRIDLDEQEISTYTIQLEQILGYVDQLQKVDTTDVSPTTRAVEVVNVLREDTVLKTYIRDDLLEQAPDRDGDFYKVPKILKT